MTATAAGPDLSLVGFDHVDLWVADLSAATRFFSEKMGLDVLSSNEDHTFLIFGDQVLGLRRAETGRPSSIVHHVALRVSAFDGLRDRLERRGLPITDERHRPGSDSLFIEGPGGLSIELIHRPMPGPPECATAGGSGSSQKSSPTGAKPT